MDHERFLSHLLHKLRLQSRFARGGFRGWWEKGVPVVKQEPHDQKDRGVAMPRFPHPHLLNAI